MGFDRGIIGFISGKSLFCTIQWNTMVVPFHGGGCGIWLGRLNTSLDFFLWRQWDLLGILGWSRNAYLRLAFVFFASDRDLRDVPFHGSGCGRWLGRLDTSVHFFLWQWWGLLGILGWSRNTYLRLTSAFFASDRDICRYFFGN